MSVPLRWQEPEIVQEPNRVSCAPSRRRARRGARLLQTLTTIGVLGLAMTACTLFGIRIGSANAAATPNLRMVSVPAGNGRVLLTNTSVERRLGFVTVTGSVFNRSKQKLSHVEAVVELLDSRNRTLQVETALIAFDPLPVGQSAPFRVEMRDDTHATGSRVGFRSMFGAALD